MTELRESTYFILTALLEGPRHGYAIIQSVRALSDDRVRLSAGTLYGALGRLLEEGLVEVEREEFVEGRRRRYHRLTDAGSGVLRAEAQQLRDRAQLVEERLGLIGRLREAGA
jgi:DNA-binding PadR family transcriptional regulator